MTNPGKEARFIKSLQDGRTISRKQAASWYKIGNPSATVLRAQETKGIEVTRTYAGSGKTRRVKYSISQD